MTSIFINIYKKLKSRFKKTSLDNVFIAEEFFKLVLKLKKSHFSTKIKTDKVKNFFNENGLDFLINKKIILKKIINNFILFRRFNLSKKTLNNLNLSLEEWLLLYSMYSRMARLKDALFFRNQAKSIAIKNKYKPIYFQRYMGCLYENNNLSSLNKFYKKQNKFIKPSLNNIVNTYLFINKFFSNNNFYISKIFLNKKILLIGTKGRFKLKDNKYDYYALLNNFEVPEIEKKQVIRILSGGFINNFNQSDVTKLINNSKYVFFQYKEHMEVFSKNKNRKNFFFIDSNLQNFFNGKPAGIQRALICLLKLKPLNLKVVNLDFFLTLNFPKYYVSSKLINENIMRFGTFTFHDLFFQFIFVKNLFDNKIIDTDNKIKKILRLSVDSYAEKLEKIYYKQFLNL